MCMIRICKAILGLEVYSWKTKEKRKEKKTRIEKLLSFILSVFMKNNLILIASGREQVEFPFNDFQGYHNEFSIPR